MTKRQLIDEIVTINRSARPAFLARFDDPELDEYLQHLRWAQTPRLSGEAHRYDHYFDGCPTTSAKAAPLAAADRQYDGDEQDRDPAEPAGPLDLKVSANAFFTESYEAKAS